MGPGQFRFRANGGKSEQRRNHPEINHFALHNIAAPLLCSVFVFAFTLAALHLHLHCLRVADCSSPTQTTRAPVISGRCDDLFWSLPPGDRLTSRCRLDLKDVKKKKKEKKETGSIFVQLNQVYPCSSSPPDSVRIGALTASKATAVVSSRKNVLPNTGLERC